jgi:hypothetical protein
MSFPATIAPATLETVIRGLALLFLTGASGAGRCGDARCCVRPRGRHLPELGAASRGWVPWADPGDERSASGPVGQRVSTCAPTE